jgi:predicted nucleic acid-binding protein
MSWVVDTCDLLDILEDDPAFGLASARCLKARLNEGLLACPVTLLELAPAFLGDLGAQREFLAQCGVSDSEDFTMADIRIGYSPWNDHIVAKRRRKSSKLPKRPIADIMIGAFACRFDGLITRNGSDFQPWFPELAILDPMVTSDSS